MKLDVLHNTDFHRNRLLRSAQQLLTAAPGDPVLGETLFYDTGAATSPLHLAVYDGLNQGTPSSLWSVLAGLNRNENINGLWAFSPAARGAGTGNGEKAPFVVGANSAFDSGGILRNWIQHLNADYLDGRHALDYSGTAPPGVGFVPVFGAAGRLACGDPVADYDAVNRKTFLAGLTGLIVLAPCRVATTARLAGARSGNVITASSVGT